MTRSAAPELVQEPSLAGRETPGGLGGPGLSFAELAYLHYRWRKALESSLPDLDRRAAHYRDARAAFEAVHGTIVDEYWCWHVPSAVVLAERPRHALVSWFLRPRIGFHRASDWVTKDHPEIAEQVHRCDEIAIRATQILSGSRRRICLQLVMNSAAHLLSFVDARAAHEDTTHVLRQETQTLDATRSYYCDAANGQAQIVYFAAMAVLAAALGALALIGAWWVQVPGLTSDQYLYGCVAAGALGAVVSVIQRINSGTFDLAYDVGRPYVAFLGGLRPVLGASFGLVLYFAVASGLLDIFKLPNENPQRFFAFFVIAFLAGFSERWAQDTLTSLGQGSGKADPATSPPHAATLVSGSRPPNLQAVAERHAPLVVLDQHEELFPTSAEDFIANCAPLLGDEAGTGDAGGRHRRSGPSRCGCVHQPGREMERHRRRRELSHPSLRPRSTAGGVASEARLGAFAPEHRHGGRNEEHLRQPGRVRRRTGLLRMDDARRPLLPHVLVLLRRERPAVRCRPGGQGAPAMREAGC